MNYQLEKNPLFSGLSNSDQDQIDSKLNTLTKNYQKGEQIASAGSEVRNLLIVLTGSVNAEMMDSSGKIIKVEELESNRLLAPAFLFGKRNMYPVDLYARTDVRLAVISKPILLDLMANYPAVLRNYLDLISNRAQFLTDKLKMLGFQSLRAKIAGYILQISGKSENPQVKLTLPQSNLAELFGVTRPAVGRIMRKMEQEGYFVRNGKLLEQIDHPKLRDLIQ